MTSKLRVNCQNIIITTSLAATFTASPAFASEMMDLDDAGSTYPQIMRTEDMGSAASLSTFMVDIPSIADDATTNPNSLIGPPTPARAIAQSEDPIALSNQASAFTKNGRMHLPYDQSSHQGFWQQAGAIKTELLILTGYVALQSVPKLFKETQSFRFKDEGWFGKNTSNVGVDKLTHAMNTYLITELLHYRLHKNTGGSHGDHVTAAIIATGAMAINELSDAIEPNGGYSMQDITMNVAGAAFSVLRNSVPGLKEKLSFKVEVVPNKHIYSRQGKEHFAQQRYMFSLKGAGFKGLNGSPLRYLDAQIGYYASDFLLEDRAAGITPKRHLFVGLGLNVGELLFRNSRSRIGRAAHSMLDYVQLPYTSLRYDTTGRFGT